MIIKIRSLKEEDYNKVRSIDILTQKQYLGKTWDKLPDSDKEKHLITKRSEFSVNIKTRYCLIAYSDNETLGFIFANRDKDFKENLHIRYVAIKPEYQGKGVGLLLYRSLIKKAKQNGIKTINALINLDNPNSIKLHQKIGFTLKDRKEATLIL